MLPSENTAGTWPLFQFRGIRVFLHWSWFLVAVYHINQGKGIFPHIGWDIAVYVSLFAIVLIHEFGHAFATRQVGGTADRILLWPFGGIAYVQTPPRPGGYLWAIAAGPLVNVALFPVLYGLLAIYTNPLDFDYSCMITASGEISYLPYFLYRIFLINTGLLIFNLIPAFPLDGGQLLRGLLWYKLGPVRSLWYAAWTGLIIGVTAMIWVYIEFQRLWTVLIIGLMVMQSWATIQRIRAWRQEAARPLNSAD